MCSLRENMHEIDTVHSVHSNVAKIHSRLPAAMEFCLYVSGFWHIYAKTPRGIVVCEPMVFR